MDTPLHAMAAPEANPASLKRPEVAAGEILADIVSALHRSNPSDRDPARVANQENGDFGRSSLDRETFGCELRTGRHHPGSKWEIVCCWVRSLPWSNGF
jgi:hypothetical protein